MDVLAATGGTVRADPRLSQDIYESVLATHVDSWPRVEGG